ncbi:unnamed protein product, partial [Ectocarpus sp. 12 AP-2014]
YRGGGINARQNVPGLQKRYRHNLPRLRTPLRVTLPGYANATANVSVVQWRTTARGNLGCGSSATCCFGQRRSNCGFFIIFCTLTDPRTIFYSRIKQIVA